MIFRLSALLLASLIFPFGSATAFLREEQTEQKSANPPMFVLQIGINDYKYESPDLSGASDVARMRELLTGEAYKIPKENVRTLCDGGSAKDFDGSTITCDGAATKENIKKEFETHLIKNARDYYQKTGNQAVILFEFSGHGSQVKDLNNDEREDGLDETFVTWDSADAAGKNLDITDDEIYDLTTRLSPYTDNIVYIFDSCHSGSGTRGADGERNLPARKSAVVPFKSSQQSTRGEDLPSQALTEKKTQTDLAQADVLPPSENYIVISAAQAGERAGQKNFFPDKQATKPVVFGYLTFYLLEELKNATPTTSYRDVMENVRRKVSAERPAQTPQIEGNDNRIVFSGLSRVKQPGIKISEVRGRQIVVEAGAMQGITPGTILDIYSVADEKIASAKVADNIAATQAVADVIEAKSATGVLISPLREISVVKKDRAILIAPDLGAARVKFLLDGTGADKLDAGDKKTIEALRANFALKNGQPNARGVDLVTGDQDGGRSSSAAIWDVALRKGKFGETFKDRAQAAPVIDKAASTARKTVYKKLPGDDEQIFYLSDKSDAPLYGFFVEAKDENAAQIIAATMEKLVSLRAVKTIANPKSRLNKTQVAKTQSKFNGKTIVKTESRLVSPINIKPFRFKLAKPPCGDGNVKMLEKEYVELDAASKNYKFGLGEIFGFEITNTSNTPLYITLLDIGTDGSVAIRLPLKIEEQKQEGVVLPTKTGEKTIVFPFKCIDEVYQTTVPTGIETFKVIATTAQTSRADFEFLEIESLNGTRSGEKITSLASLADWTTSEVNFEISSKQKKP